MWIIISLGMVRSRTRGSRQVSSIRNASGMWKGLSSQFQAYFLDINAVVQLEVIPSGFGGPGGAPDARMSSCSPCFGLAIHIRARAQSRGTLWRKTQRGRENSRKRWGKRWRDKIKTSSAEREETCPWIGDVGEGRMTRVRHRTRLIPRWCGGFRML